MTAIVRADSIALPLKDESVDLIISSPPYFALRTYQDGDEGHYEGQLGDEPRPQDFLEALWTVTEECKRVLKPTGSMFINLGDKMSGSGGHNNAELETKGNKHASGAGREIVEGAARRNAPSSYNKSSVVVPGYGPAARMSDLEIALDLLAVAGRATDDPVNILEAMDWVPAIRHLIHMETSIPAKSLMFLPERYRIGCVDLLGLIARAVIVWDKPNGLPESVTDRVRRNHEDWVHLTKQGSYYAAIDELREPHEGVDNAKSARGPSGMNRGLATGTRDETVGNFARDPAGKLPPSVWRIPTEPLRIPQSAKDAHDLPDHFAAFPTEWVRRLVLGWSPNGICLACAVGRFPVVGLVGESASIVGYACDCTPYVDHEGTGGSSGRTYAEAVAAGDYVSNDFGGRLKDRPKVSGWREYDFDGWADPPKTRKAKVLDIFGGTGTVAMVARALGRDGISVDLSAAYCRLAKWRVFQSGHDKKALTKEAEKTVQSLQF